MFKNIIFDWSGTLANDQQYTYQITNDTLENFGASPISFVDYVRNFKIPVDKFYLNYISHKTIQEIDEYFFNQYIKKIDQIKLFEKSKLILSFAKEFGIDLYICSTLDQDILNLATKNLGIHTYFKKIYGNCFDKIKSLPQIINENHLGYEESIYIGDTPHDIEAGKTARIQCGAILYGYTPPEIMLNQNPDESFKNPEDLFFKLSALYAPDYYARPVATVGGLIFDQNNRVLLIRTDKWSKKWGIPGGKIKFNESMSDAFIREIKEETNLDIKDIKMICTQDCIQHPEFYLPRHFLLVNFTAKAVNLDVRLNYESTEFKWTSLDEALTMDLNEPTRILIEKVKI